MKISTRISLMVVTSILAAILIGAVGIFVSNKEVESIRNIKEDSLISIETLGEVRQTYMELRVLVYTHLVNTDPATLKSLETRLKETYSKLESLLKKYETLAFTAEDKTMLETEVGLIKKYGDLMAVRVIALSKQNDKEGARNLIVKEGTSLGAELRKALGDHMAFNTNTAEQHALDNAQKGQTVAIGIIVAVVLSMSLFGYFMVAGIRRSLGQIQDMVGRVESSLDFTVRVDVTKKDEIGQTTLALNRLLDKLQGNLQTLAGSAKSVSAASNLMTITSTEVAKASHQQSESASDMAATVEEMTVSINHVGERALEANRLTTFERDRALRHSRSRLPVETPEALAAPGRLRPGDPE